MRKPPMGIPCRLNGRASELLRAGVSALAIVCAAGAALVAPMPAQAQTAGVPTPELFAAPKPGTNSEMLVQADELVYDNDRQTVTAAGGVQIFHEGYTVLAQKVIYNKKEHRLIAEGKVRITDAQGNVYNAEHIDLTENLRDGFVRTLRLERTDKTRFAADSAERQPDDITIFNNGVYTACEPCKKDPTKPPLWQVKAARIIHKQQEQTIYYENAQLEFFGMPIAYLPYFWSPDASVKRKSGFLPMEFTNKSGIGTGVAMPYYFALSPFYDLTVTPTVISPQGLHMDAEWRHSLPNGWYRVKVSGINQQDPDSVGTLAFDPGRRDWRGAFQSTGKLLLTHRWTFGWDVTVDSDQRYLKDYNYIPETALEKISTVYLQGMGERSFFDLRGYYTRSLTWTQSSSPSTADRQGLMPLVLPVMDYNTVTADPYMGGEFRLNVNATSLTRADAATYRADTSGKYFTPGFAGDYTRASVDLGWRKTYTDPLGQRWTPFWSLRGDAYTFGVSSKSYDVVDINGGSLGSIASDNTSLFSLYANQGSGFRGMATLGLDYRYPLIALSHDGTSHIIEPIAQLLLRPDEQKIGQLPNEDAHSLVFDDSNLFSANKFSGYDRIEGGSRVNAGLQYSIHSPSGAMASFLFGQSIHIGGMNSFAPGTVYDYTGTAINSGLDKARSDYVARAYFQPWQYGDFAARFRFDEATMALKRTELDARATLGPLYASATYTFLAPQPDLGYTTNREQVSGFASLKLDDKWSIYGGLRYSLQNISGKQGLVSDQLGLKYQDDCFGVNIDYSTIYQAYGDLEPRRQIFVRFSLRTLGEAGFKSNLGLNNTQ